jgi:hypothetical protein
MPGVDLKECRRLKEDYDRLCRWREALCESVAITSRHITEIDRLLIEHPLLKPSMDMAIKSRTIRALWLEYEDEETSAQHKRQILLSLRDCYQALPEHYREEFAELWWRWLDVFEEQEVANGTRTSRRYVWSPLGGSHA